MAKNVLLIEYEQRDRNRVRSLLAPPDFTVTEAHDGEEGLAAFGWAGERFAASTGYAQMMYEGMRDHYELDVDSIGPNLAAVFGSATSEEITRPSATPPIAVMKSTPR